MFNFASALIALAIAHTALAKVYITNPVATTQQIGGQVLNVKWADDGESPTVSAIGVSSIDLYTGNVNQQTFLQNLAASVDVSKTSEISATINPTVGENGDFYFIRVTSAALKSQVNPQYPYQAFSAKFNINNMSGTFNATVLAQIDNDTTASSSSAAVVASSATAANAVNAAASSATSNQASAVTSKSGSSSTPSSSAKSTGAGVATYGTPAAALVAVAGLTSYLVL